MSCLDAGIAENAKFALWQRRTKRQTFEFSRSVISVIALSSTADIRSQVVIGLADPMRSQIATGSKRKIRYRPWVFTEHGPLQAANILRSDRAIAMSVYVIRAFIEQRERLAANAAILKRLAEIDKTLLEHDTALRDIYQKLLPLLAPPPELPRRQSVFRLHRKLRL
jgi:hypothetical protein